MKTAKVPWDVGQGLGCRGGWLGYEGKGKGKTQKRFFGAVCSLFQGHSSEGGTVLLRLIGYLVCMTASWGSGMRLLRVVGKEV